jgi:hypothetical protein
MFNPNGESGAAGESGVGLSLEVRIIAARPMGMMARLLSACQVQDPWF